MAELAWVETLGTIDMDKVDYEDFVECANRYIHKLKEEDHCDMVIALTHMRVPNDEKITRECPGLDLVLGGHDHDYGYYVERSEAGEQAGELLMVKSGCDFREISILEVDTYKEEDEFSYDFPLVVPAPSKGYTVTCTKV